LLRILLQRPDNTRYFTFIVNFIYDFLLMLTNQTLIIKFSVT